LLFADQIDNVAREDFCAATLEQAFAHLVDRSNAPFEVVSVYDVVGILEQFAKAFFEGGFIFELLANEFCLRAHLLPQQSNPRQSGENDGHHSSREHEKVRQRPPRRSLKEVNVLRASQH